MTFSRNTFIILNWLEFFNYPVSLPLVFDFYIFKRFVFYKLYHQIKPTRQSTYVNFNPLLRLRCNRKCESSSTTTHSLNLETIMGFFMAIVVINKFLNYNRSLVLISIGNNVDQISSFVDNLCWDFYSTYRCVRLQFILRKYR